MDYATATHISMITKGLLISHDQDGTLKAGAVDNAAALASNVVTTAKINNAAVTPDKLSTGAALAYVATSETTTSSSYADLATTTDTVTATIGANGLALVTVYATASSATSGAVWYVGFAISGATTQAAADNFALQGVSAVGTQTFTGSSTFLLTGLTAGSTVFKMKYKSDGTHTATFSTRRISVVPL